MQNFNKNVIHLFITTFIEEILFHQIIVLFLFPLILLKSSNSNFFPNNQESEKKSDSKNNNIQSNTPSKSLPPNKDFVLDLFGLKLYFDDVLILSLIFFLYKEDVKDEGLFLALVLLLIS